MKILRIIILLIIAVPLLIYTYFGYQDRKQISDLNEICKMYPEIEYISPKGLGIFSGRHIYLHRNSGPWARILGKFDEYYKFNGVKEFIYPYDIDNETLSIMEKDVLKDWVRTKNVEACDGGYYVSADGKKSLCVAKKFNTGKDATIITTDSGIISYPTARGGKIVTTTARLVINEHGRSLSESSEKLLFREHMLFTNNINPLSGTELVKTCGAKQ